MAKEIVLKLKLDGGKEAVRIVDDLGDGLHDLDVRNAREAAQAIESIGRDGNLKNTVHDVDALKKILDNVDDDQLKQAQQATKQLGADAEKTANTYRDASGRLRDANGKFVSSANATKQAANSLGNEIKSAADKAKAAAKDFDSFKSAGEKIQNAGNKMQSFGQQLTVGVTLPIIGLGVAAVRVFSDIEEAVAEISTIKPEIDTTQVQNSLNDLSTKYRLTAVELGEGLYNIFSSVNVSQTEALTLLESFAKGATAAKTDVATFGTAVLGVMNAYKLSVADAAHISDVFFNTVNLGVVNGEQLASSLGTVTQAGKNMGVAFDELGALIVGVTKEGGEASQNINNLANVLMKLPTKEAVKDLEALGVKVSDKGKFRPIIDVLTELKAKLSTMSESDAAQTLQKIFPDAQARTGVQTLLSQLDSVKQALEVNKTTAGATDAAYQKIAATANVQFALLKNSAIAILAELGSVILPLLQPLVSWLSQELVPAVNDAMSAFRSWSPEMQRAALIAALVAAAIPPILTIFGTLVVAIGAVVTAFGTIAGVVGSIGLAPLVAILAAVVTALAAVGVAAYGAYQAFSQNIGGIQQTATEVFNSLKTIIEPAIAEVSQFIHESFASVIAWVDTNLPTIIEAVQNVVKWIQKIWSENGEQIKTIVSAAWNIIKTIITTVGQQIGNVILLIANLINGNWAGAWQNFKAIITTGVEASITIFKQLLVIIWEVLKAIVTRMISMGQEIYNAAISLGKYIIQGLLNGIANLAASVYDKVRSVANGMLGTLRGVFQTQSPSKVTTEIGQFFSEGLANGVNNSAPLAVAASKKLADDVLKQLIDAQKQFTDFAKLSPGQQAQIASADNYSQALNDLKEIIKLRNQTATNLDRPLPNTIDGVNGELNFLRGKIKAAEDAQKSFNKSLEDLQKGWDEAREAAEKYTNQVEDYKEKMSESGTTESIRMQKEIALMGVTDEVQKQQIENYYELIQLRATLKNDGYAEEDIKDILRIRAAIQGENLELVKLKVEKQKQIDAAKELADAEKKAAEEAAQAMRETWQKTYDFIRDTLDILTDENLSFGEKFKEIFGGIKDRIQSGLLDKFSSTITTQLLGFDPNENNPVAKKIDASNILLRQLVANTGGGAGVSAPIFSSPNIIGGGFGGGSSSGIGGLFGGLLGSLFGGSSGNTGSVGYGSRTGDVLNGVTQIFGGDNGRQDVWSNLKYMFSTRDGGLFGKGGIFGDKGFGNNVGTYGAIGSAASLLGGLFGGRFGGALSGAGTGLAIGAQIGSIVPGIGTAIGAGVGAAVGFFAGLFGNGQRKADEQTRTQALQIASGEFDKLIGALNARPPQIEAASARSQADSIISQYNSAMGTLKDKKTREIALREWTHPQGHLFSKNQQLESAMKTALQWQVDDANRKKVASSFTGEFANGVFISDEFKRLNGLMPGVYTGKDYIKALIGDGEMVLNAAQQMRVIANAKAGYDNPFADAGIPNYKPAPEPPRFASGVSFSPVTTSSGNSGNSSKPSEVVFEKDSIVINLNGKRITDAEIESIAINGVTKKFRGFL